MPVRSVLIYGDPLLRQKSAEVSAEEITSSEFQTFLDDLQETLYSEDGVGLAAPQVGVLQRVFFIDVGWAERKGKTPVWFINPVVEPYGDLEDYDEGCLSLPDIRGHVKRPGHVRVSYTDREGRAQTLDADGLMARCAQHEFDHLDGVLYVDRLSYAGKVLVQGKLKRLKQGQQQGRR